MTEQRTITVDGMTCGACEQSVQSALTQLEGVQHVTADHTNRAVDVRFDGIVVGEDAIRDQIRQAGYIVPA